MRDLLRNLSPWLVVLALCTLTQEASAYAWMVRHGYAKCATCHTDPSGGETLGHMGRITSQSLLSQRLDDSTAPTDAAGFLFGAPEPDWARLGGSVRGMGIYDTKSQEYVAFPMQADLYGSVAAGPVRAGFSVGVSRASGRWEHTDKAALTGTVEKGEFMPVSRSHWLGFEPADQMLVRAGRINLPFGVRVPEHTQWVRDVTATDRESDQQHGLAFAYWGGAWRAELMAVAGNFQLYDDAFRERGYAGYAEYLVSTRTALGLSSQWLTSKEGLLTGIEDQVRQAHGLMGRYSPMELLTIMGEFDVLLQSEREMGYVGLLVADLEPLRGIHFTLTGEVLDRGQSETADETPMAATVIPEDAGPAPGAGEPRLGGWGSVSWFPMPHFDLRADIVARQNRPMQVMLQGHFYF